MACLRLSALSVKCHRPCLKGHINIADGGTDKHGQSFCRCTMYHRLTDTKRKKKSWSPRICPHYCSPHVSVQRTLTEEKCKDAEVNKPSICVLTSSRRLQQGTVIGKNIIFLQLNIVIAQTQQTCTFQNDVKAAVHTFCAQAEMNNKKDSH